MAKKIVRKVRKVRKPARRKAPITKSKRVKK